MMIKGTFKGYKVIYKLDCKIIAEVMALYEEQKKIILSNYNEQIRRNLILLREKKNQISDEKKEEIVLSGLKESFKNFKETGFIDFGRIYLYDYLDELGVMPKDLQTKKAVLNQAKKNIKTQSKKAISKTEKAMYKIIDNGKLSSTVIIECKKISLKRFYSQFKEIDQMIKKINNTKQK
jgi:hypothetical protein